MSEHEVRITLGRLLCGGMRDYLEQQRLRHPELRYTESSGWIERTFLIIGPRDVMLGVERDIRAWADRLEEEDRSRI